MALSYKIHTATTGDVSGTADPSTGELLGYSFNFPSLSADHISVTVNGVAKTRTVDYTVENWTAPDGGNNPYIKFTTDAARGSGTIRIFRQTTDTTPSHDFQVGSAIKAADLNSCNKQNIYLAQENRDSINSLSLGSYQAATTIDSDNIVNFSIEGEDIQSNAITDVKVDTNAAIQGTKISPNFGSQNIITTGDLGSESLTITSLAPIINFNDTNNFPDYRIVVQSGEYKVQHTTGGNTDRFVINTDGHVDVTGNLDVGAGIDVTGNSTVSGNSTVTGNLSVTGVVTGTPGGGNSLVPVGTVIWFVGVRPPRGFLKCNGASINDGNTTFAYNYSDNSAIGTIDTSGLYGLLPSGVLPDIRGEFIRGGDDGKGTDTGRNIRSLQGDQMEQHNHNYTYRTGQWNGETSNERSNAWHSTQSQETSNVGGTSNNSENRPRNIALLACIKF